MQQLSTMLAWSQSGLFPGCALPVLQKHSAGCFCCFVFFPGAVLAGCSSVNWYLVLWLSTQHSARTPASSLLYRDPSRTGVYFKMFLYGWFAKTDSHKLGEHVLTGRFWTKRLRTTKKVFQLIDQPPLFSRIRLKLTSYYVATADKR